MNVELLLTTCLWAFILKRDHGYEIALSIDFQLKLVYMDWLQVVPVFWQSLPVKKIA